MDINIQDLIKKIFNNNFNQGDIELFFYKLREEQGISQELIEIGHMIHKKRNQGLFLMI